MDFDWFKSNVLKPDDYVDTAKAQYDAGNDSNDFPAYMAVYEFARDICEEPRSIVDGGADLNMLSIFCELPLLREVVLSFDETPGDGFCLLNSEALCEDELYLHHLQVVASAIQNAYRKGMAVDTVSLRGFSLPYFHSWENPELHFLTESFRLLLDGVKVLHLRQSGCVLELLSACTLQLRQLDMCNLTTADVVLTDFLQANKKTIRSIGFHKVDIWASSPRLTSSRLMTASILRSMLDLPQHTPCETVKCDCLSWRNEGSRLVIGGNIYELSDHPVSFAKSKFDHHAQTACRSSERL